MVLNNKKGSVRDIALITVILFSVGLVSFLMLYVYNSASNLMLEEPLINNTAAGDVLVAHQSTMAGLDYIFLAIMIGFLMATVITAYLVGGHPIFVGLYIIFFIVIGLLAGLLTYVWESLSDLVVFGTTVSNLPITNFILDNLTLFILVIGFVGLIAMYVRGQRIE